MYRRDLSPQSVRKNTIRKQYSTHNNQWTFFFFFYVQSLTQSSNDFALRFPNSFGHSIKHLVLIRNARTNNITVTTRDDYEFRLGKKINKYSGWPAPRAGGRVGRNVRSGCPFVVNISLGAHTISRSPTRSQSQPSTTRCVQLLQLAEPIAKRRRRCRCATAATPRVTAFRRRVRLAREISFAECWHLFRHRIMMGA